MAPQPTQFVSLEVRFLVEICRPRSNSGNHLDRQRYSLRNVCLLESMNWCENDPRLDQILFQTSPAIFAQSLEEEDDHEEVLGVADAARDGPLDCTNEELPHLSPTEYVEKCLT